MAKITGRKAPSRVRYEQGHPTVTCRVPREVYDKLHEVKEAKGKSFADILKIGLRILEERVEEEGKIRKKDAFTWSPIPATYAERPLN